MSGPTFKDFAAADIFGTFVNTDEFADVHTVDGREMHIIIDTNELIERQKNLNNHTDGLYKAHILVYIPISEYGPRPKIGKQLNLDNKKIYTIVDCINEDGIYSMELEAARA